MIVGALTVCALPQKLRMPGASLDLVSQYGVVETTFKRNGEIKAQRLVSGRYLTYEEAYAAFERREHEEHRNA